MGTYFNPNHDSFLQAVNSFIYVDKTELLEYTNSILGTEGKCIALSHARRFGKSQVARMIDAYYSRGCDSTELFSRFKIAQKEDFLRHLNKYNVIHFDVSTFLDFYRENLVEKIIENIYRELREEYPDVDYNQSIAQVLSQIAAISRIKFVIIIDEWDCVVRNLSNNPDLVHRYLQFLHALFKSEEAQYFLALAYITGILPIKKIKDESALNNFREFTMMNSRVLAPYFGFTEDEVKTLCYEHDMSFNTIRDWYDGYLINGYHIYNPNSVYEAIVNRSVEPYWRNTSSFATLNDLITLNYDGLKDDVLEMLKGGRVRVDICGFQNDLSTISTKDDALTALIHLGYLAYDSERAKAFIPNYEVNEAYKMAIETGNWKEIAKSISLCQDLLWATFDKDAERVAEILELSHETYTSILKYNDENSLACAITMAYFTAPAYYTVIRELPSGKGFADFAFIPRADTKGKPAMIVELKWDKSAESAIKQIKERKYTGALRNYSDNILLVGINYDKDSDNKKHQCVIEEIKAKTDFS